MKRLGTLAGLVFGLGLAAPAAAGTTAPRLEWQPEACRLSWHRSCSFAPTSDLHGCPSHRFTTLEGRLRAFSPEDASLYAVFLASRSDLADLERALSGASIPSILERFPHAWLPLDPNGEITVRADEADQSGKTWVAVVNASGEILGSHPLWSATGDLASSR